MKWKDSDFKSGITSIRAVLIYGPDAGQVDEYCDRAIDILQIEKDNLFALDSNEISEKQDALFAESCSPSMFGGNKMVLISNAGDACAKQVAELVNHPGLCATVIVAGNDLRAGGGLRSLFEGADNMAALPCYTDDARTLATLIRNEVSASAGVITGLRATLLPSRHTSDFSIDTLTVFSSTVTTQPVLILLPSFEETYITHVPFDFP